MQRQKVTIRAEKFPDLVVDRVRGTLLNTNTKRMAMYKKRRAEIHENKHNVTRIKSLEDQILSLKNIVDKLVKS